MKRVRETAILFAALPLASAADAQVTLNSVRVDAKANKSEPIAITRRDSDDVKDQIAHT